MAESNSSESGCCCNPATGGGSAKLEFNSLARIKKVSSSKKQTGFSIAIISRIQWTGGLRQETLVAGIIDHDLIRGGSLKRKRDLIANIL